jgi:hypothetical protein
MNERFATLLKAAEQQLQLVAACSAARALHRAAERWRGAEMDGRASTSLLFGSCVGGGVRGEGTQRAHFGVAQPVLACVGGPHSAAVVYTAHLSVLQKHQETLDVLFDKRKGKEMEIMKIKGKNEDEFQRELAQVRSQAGRCARGTVPPARPACSPHLAVRSFKLDVSEKWDNWLLAAKPLCLCACEPVRAMRREGCGARQ